MGISSKPTNSLNVSNEVEQSLPTDSGNLKIYVIRFLKIALFLAIPFIAWRLLNPRFDSEEMEKQAKYFTSMNLGRPHW